MNDLAHVAGWDPHNPHDLAHFSWNWICTMQILYNLPTTACETDANGNAMLPKKMMNFKHNRHKISVPLAMSTKSNLEKKVPSLKKQKRKKTIPGQMLSQHRPEKNSAKCSIRSNETPSPRQTSIDKANDCVMKSERGTLTRGSDPPSGHKCSQHGR